MMTHNNRHNPGTDLLGKLQPCRSCQLLPSLLTMDVWEFDYNRLEHLGNVRKGYQFVCRGCYRHTLMFNTVHSAFAHWNSEDFVKDVEYQKYSGQDSEELLTAIRNGG